MQAHTISVNGKTFRRLYSAQEIGVQVRRVASEIKRDVDGKRPLFLCVLNGSFVFAADLLREAAVPCEIRFVRLSSYDGTKSTGKVKNVLGLDADIQGRTVIIVEDIVETGGTMHALLSMLRKENPESIEIAALVTKPERLREDINIKYVGFKMKASDFIVGYGMDYNEEGRNLSDIYIAADEDIKKVETNIL